MEKESSWWVVFHCYTIPTTGKLVETQDLKRLLACHIKFMQSDRVIESKLDKNFLSFTSHSDIQPTIRLSSWVKISDLKIDKSLGPGVLLLGIMRQSANQGIFVVPRWNLGWGTHCISSAVFQNTAQKDCCCHKCRTYAFSVITTTWIWKTRKCQSKRDNPILVLNSNNGVKRHMATWIKVCLDVSRI